MLVHLVGLVEVGNGQFYTPKVGYHSVEHL